MSERDSSTLFACTHCGLLKDRSAFDRQSARASGHRPECKVCAAQIKKKWRERNPVEHLRRAVEWGRKNPEARRAIYRRHHERHREERNRQSREWQKAHLALGAEFAASRRAAEKRATPGWADKKRMRDIYAACPPGYHVDHIVPINGTNVCGLHVPENLQYLPAAENIGKKNRYTIT